MKKDAVSMKAAKCLALTACAMFCGCDVEIPSLRKATEQVAKYSLEQAPKEAGEPAAAQVANERAALEHFAASRLKMVEASAAQAEKRLREIRSDCDSMSKRVNEISEKVFADKNAGAEDVLLELLKDPDLNSLALKYLGNDFALMNTEFVSEVRSAAAKEKERELALSENMRNYRETIARADGKEAAAARQAANDAANQQKKIDSMEKRLRQMRSAMVGSRDARMKKDREIRNLESEIQRARNRLDSIRRESGMRSSGSSRIQTQVRFDNVNKDIERRYRNMMTVKQVADEYGQNTVRKLDAAMRSKEAKLESEMATLASQKVFISSVSSGIDKLGMEDLKAVRAEIEKALAKKPEAAAKGK